MKRLVTYGLVAFAGSFLLTVLALTFGIDTVPLRELTVRTHSTTTNATVQFVGDLMFDRYIRKTAHPSYDHALAGVSDLLTKADSTIGNLEGPLTEFASVSLGTAVGDETNMRFTFAPQVAEALKRYGFDLVSVGNNHIRDFGDEGVRSTERHLLAAGIPFVGSPLSLSDEPVVLNVKGIRFAFVSYSDFTAGDATRAREAISAAQETGADAVIVLAHWGTEYEFEPPERVRTLAHTFVEAGANLIIGTHPHVIGRVEDIGRARVYYSLGNFVFDQYFADDVRCGLSVAATFTKRTDEISVTYHETHVGLLSDGRTVMGCNPPASVIE